MRRRDFAGTLLIGGIGLAACTSQKSEAEAHDGVNPELLDAGVSAAAMRKQLNLPEGDVEVTVAIEWMPDGEPVVGASVFDHSENSLLGKTDEAGKLVATVPNGSIIRLVEPEYGQQQALRLTQGELVNGRDVRVARMGEGWTI